MTLRPNPSTKTSRSELVHLDLLTVLEDYRQGPAGLQVSNGLPRRRAPRADQTRLARRRGATPAMRSGQEPAAPTPLDLRSGYPCKARHDVRPTRFHKLGCGRHPTNALATCSRVGARLHLSEGSARPLAFGPPNHQRFEHRLRSVAADIRHTTRRNLPQCGVSPPAGHEPSKHPSASRVRHRHRAVAADGPGGDDELSPPQCHVHAFKSELCPNLWPTSGRSWRRWSRNKRMRPSPN